MRVFAMAVLLLGCTSPEKPLPFGARAGDCASCHPVQHDEWSASRHAASSESAVFRALLPRVEAAWGPAARDACVQCHAPGHGGDAAIGCASCHAAVGNTAEHSGRLVVDLERPIAGPFADAEPTPAHASREGGFLASPSLCGTCHEVRGPGLFDEPTLSEYRASGFAAAGTTCVDCHMPAVDDGPVAEGVTHSRPRRSHRFRGFDATMLAEALAVWIEPQHGGARVILENAGAAHDVPTGVSFLRDIWVDVRVVAADGTEVTHERVLELGSRPTRDGEPVALVTDADAIEHRTLALGERGRATIALPDYLRRPLRVEATVRARAVRAAILEELGLAHGHDAPVLEVRSVEATLE